MSILKRYVAGQWVPVVVGETGPQGEQGIQGVKGDKGDTGLGVPDPIGTEGQVVTVSGGTTVWADPAASISALTDVDEGSGFDDGDVLVYDANWDVWVPQAQTAIVNGYATETYVDTVANGYVSKTSVSGSIITIVGERNAAASVGQYYAFGNGANDQEVPMPYPGKVIAAALVGGPSHTGTTTVELYKNYSGQGATYTFSATGTTSNVAEFDPPLSFVAGDTLNWNITAAGTGNGSTITTVIRLD